MIGIDHPDRLRRNAAKELVGLLQRESAVSDGSPLVSDRCVNNLCNGAPTGGNDLDRTCAVLVCGAQVVSRDTAPVVQRFYGGRSNITARRLGLGKGGVPKPARS